MVSLVVLYDDSNEAEHLCELRYQTEAGFFSY